MHAHVPTHIPEGPNRRGWAFVLLVLTLLAAWLKYESEGLEAKQRLRELEQAGHFQEQLREETRGMPEVLHAIPLVAARALEGSAALWSGCAPGASFDTTIAAVVSLDGAKPIAFEAELVRYTLVARDASGITVEVRRFGRSSEPSVARVLVPLAAPAAPGAGEPRAVTSRAGTFACRRRVSRLDLDGHAAVLEEWLAPEVPVPVKSALVLPGSKYGLEGELEPGSRR